MISRSRLYSRIGKYRLKATARESAKDLDYLCRLFSREVKYAARMSDFTIFNQISFAIHAVSVVSPAIAHYLLFCVGYSDISPILKSIRRHDRKKLRGH